MSPTLRMTMRRALAASAMAAVALLAIGAADRAIVDAAASGRGATADTVGRVVRSDAEWKRILSPEAYRILRRAGTEIAFTGAYWNHHASGMYRCAGCGLVLFDSHAKFDSGTGWPSYWQPFKADRVRLIIDTSDGMVRQEVRCARCGGHLGHVFDDGPPPTRLRYCINSAALTFQPAARR